QVRLEPKTDQNVVSYTTMIDVPNADLKLKPGMTANVTVEIASSQDALRVPNSALKFRPTPELFAALGQPIPENFAANAAGRAPSGATGTAGAGADPTVGSQRLPEQRAQFRAQRAADGTAGGFGRVWVMRGGALQTIRVQTGVSDGAVTAVVGGDLK